jgi:uncharacterized membrane protein YhhN
MTGGMRGGMRARSVYCALAVSDTVLAAAGLHRPRWATKPLLMPLLFVDADRRSQRALTLSWAGDVALMGNGKAAFTAGLGSFLGAQVAWIDTLRSRPGSGLLRRRPVVAVPYLVTLVGLNAYLWRRSGSDRIPVLVYSAALTAMALTAADSGDPATAAGGALFFTSDALIALDRFGDVHLPGHDGWVMGTYTAAQALLAGSPSDQ